MNTLYFYIGTGVVVLLVIFTGMYYFLHPSASTNSTAGNVTIFGSAQNNSTSVNTNNASSNSSSDTNLSQEIPANTEPQQKITEITAGPVVGATLYQTLNPTTTLARYINTEDGHVYDVPLGVPGAIARVVSNTTIPGGVRALWTAGGNAIMQYLEGPTVKTLDMTFPTQSLATTSTQGATRIQFFPDGIEDIAVSPDGKSAVYLLTTSSGVDGYIAQSNGLNSKKIFSLPLSQILISWPSQGTILAQSKPAAGVPGIIFSISATTGAATPLLYAPGITATADYSFAHVVYQSARANATVRLTYLHNVKAGTDMPLSFSPIPEKCAWGNLATSTMYCAAPLQYVPATYLDLWHAGVASAADALYGFNILTGNSSILATPGTADGGNAADIYELALSPDEHYLSYVTKGGRSLWVVQLAH